MVVVQAPAKINLTLDIVGKRPDGYHDVAMVMQAVSLYDTVSVSMGEGEGDDVSVSCPAYPDVPVDGRNIVCKAASAFYRRTGVKSRPITVAIDKLIPTGAGLAGGSSDGAAVVMALNRLYDTRLAMDEMADICASFGSDVPFCLSGGTQLATETGTTLKGLPAMPKCHLVICKPDVSVSTAEAYARCDARDPKSFLYTDEMVKRIFSRDLRGIASCLYNEFEEVMCLDEIMAIKRTMLSQKALGASMTGSGSAVYAIFDSEKRALSCANALRGQYDKVFTAEPVKDGCRIR